MTTAFVAPLTLTAGRRLGPGLIAAYLDAFTLTAIPRAPGTEPGVLGVLQTIRDFDPDASDALWNFLRIANPGHDVAVTALDGTPFPEAQAYIDDLATRLWQDGGGGADTLVDVLHLAQFSYGGAGLEIELTPDLHDIVDFWPFGPADIRFQYVADPVTKQPVRAMYPARLAPGQEPVPLNSVQNFYQPLDPDLDNPYGRPPLLPAAAALLAMTNLLNEMQAVLRVQGTGKTDITIDLDKVMNQMPDAYRQPGNEGLALAFLDAIRQQVEDALKTLGPTDAFVHYSNSTVNTTTPGGQGIDIGALIAELARRVRTGLKTPAVLMGEIEGAATMGTVQWGVYVKGIKAAHRRTKRLLENGYNLALRVRGFPAMATLTFHAIRETDRMIDANTETVELNNRERQFKLGFIDHKEASNAVVEHDPTGPRPPTDADEFRLQVAQASASVAALNPLQPPGPVDVPGFTPMQPDELPAAPPPGSDAGITAEEGAALDAAANLARPQTRTAPAPDLGNDAAAVLGSDIVDAVRKALRELGATDLLDLVEAEPEPDEAEAEAAP